LQQLGYVADVASNGTEAISAVEKNSYDLIFMDVQMPGMDGLEATRRIRKWEKNSGRKPIHIIAITANAMAGDRDKCIASGMNDYLAKPVRPEALQSAIERIRNTVTVANTASVKSEAMSSSIVLASAPVTTARLAPDETEIVDWDRLTEFSGGSRTSLIEITDLYFSQTTEQLARLEEAVQQRDSAAVVRVAHSSAGASGVCGILALEPLFRAVEQFGKENRVDDAAALLPSLRQNFESVKAVLLNSRENLPLS
jgi:CheY-like chemotaxis protein/HPt (histidine-containing phosphotransfer) domain-containing protein